MRTFLAVLLVLILLAGVVVAFFAPSIYGCGSKKTLDDGFNTSTLYSGLWSAQYPSGNSGEQQYYGEDAVQIKDSKANLVATQTPANGKPYTSGIIHTKGKFSQEYGWFEIKAKLPKGKGFWPAFWLLPAKSDFPVEIDVFEMHGDDTHTIYMSLHWKGSDGDPQHITVPYTSPNDLSADFHTYAIDWSPNKLTWYLDGNQIYSTRDHIPHEPMFVLVNLAVGGSWPGNPDASTSWPGVMQIEYAHVFSQECSFKFFP